MKHVMTTTITTTTTAITTNRRRRRNRWTLLLASFAVGGLTSLLHMVQNGLYWAYIFYLFILLGNSVRTNSFSIVFVI
jgi:hypothetical protein